MQYKTPDCISQLGQSPQKLQEVAQYFESLSLCFGIEPTITRVWDAVCGDSGVHEAHRAVDFRDETRPGLTPPLFLYTQDQADFIVNSINEKYPRDDGKMTCLHHSFNGAPHHFHLQVESKWA